MKKANVISSVIILLFSIIFIIEARKMPMSDGLSPGAGFVPFWIGLCVAILSVALLIKNIGMKPLTGQKDFLKKGGGLRDIAYITLSLFVYTGLITLVGFPFSTSIFLIFLFKTMGKYSFKFSLALSIIVTFTLYGIFEYWLEMSLPVGMMVDIFV